MLAKAFRFWPCLWPTVSTGKQNRLQFGCLISGASATNWPASSSPVVCRPQGWPQPIHQPPSQHPASSSLPPLNLMSSVTAFINLLLALSKAVSSPFFLLLEKRRLQVFSGSMTNFKYCFGSDFLNPLLVMQLAKA